MTDPTTAPATAETPTTPTTTTAPATATPAPAQKIEKAFGALTLRTADDYSGVAVFQADGAFAGFLTTADIRSIEADFHLLPPPV